MSPALRPKQRQRGPAGADIARIQQWLDGSPFIRWLGLQCTAVDAGAGRLTLRLPARPELERGVVPGQFHGGAVASLIDTAGAFALVAALRVPVPTVDLRIDYLRPSGGDALTATAEVRRAGRTLGVVDVEVFDAQGRLTAVGRGSFVTATGASQ